MTTLFLRNAEVCSAINNDHENPRYLPGLKLHPAVRASTNPSALSARLVILAIPCQQQRDFLIEHKQYLTSGTIVLNVAKGIELTTYKTGSGFIPAILENLDAGYAVLSGPSFAKEVLQGQPTAVVVAGRQPDLVEHIQGALSCPFFRCYASTDVLGVEIGGAVKNVIAIAAGLCDGLGIGSNGRAALITRGLAEIVRLGTALGAQQHTFMGLSGLGDLVLTATGGLSRNRQLGLGLGQGKSLAEASAQIGMVTEGVKTAFAVLNLAKKIAVNVPITAAVCDILSGNITASQAARQLMQRDLCRE